MKLLANENFPLASVIALRELNYDIKAIGEDERSMSDRKILEIAAKENRLILTFDKDYGELIFTYGLKPTAGVIFLRLRKYSPEKPAEIIHSLLKR